MYFTDAKMLETFIPNSIRCTLSHSQSRLWHSGRTFGPHKVVNAHTHAYTGTRSTYCRPCSLGARRLTHVDWTRTGPSSPPSPREARCWWLPEYPPNEGQVRHRLVGVPWAATAPPAVSIELSGFTPRQETGKRECSGGRGRAPVS